MRSIFALVALVHSVFAIAAPVEKIFNTNITVSALHKTEVKYDRAAKAWFLELLGDMASPDWRMTNPPSAPTGVAIAVYRPALSDPYDRTAGNLRVELGTVADNVGPFPKVMPPAMNTVVGGGYPGAIYQFEAKVRLPADFGPRERALRLTVASRNSLRSPIPVVVNWDPINKNWVLAYGATDAPVLVNNPNPIVRIDRFVTVSADFSPTKLELVSPKETTAAIEGTASPTTCPGNEKKGEVVAMPMTAQELQVGLFQLHQAKNDALDPLGESCERDSKAVTYELQARFPVPMKGEIDGKITDTQRFFITAKLLGQSTRNPGSAVFHTFTLQMSKGQTDWSMNAFEEWIQP